MPESRRLQLRMLGLRVACAILGAVVLIPFVEVFVNGTQHNVAHPAIVRSAIPPLLLWCLAVPVVFCVRPNCAATIATRFAWFAGSVFLGLHIAVAFHLGHAWSHSSAWEHTRAASGVGAGVWVNYGVAVVWLTDAAWLAIAPRAYETRSRALHIAIHAFLAFVMLNAGFVFASWPVRALFAVAVTVGIVACYSTAKHN